MKNMGIQKKKNTKSAYTGYTNFPFHHTITVYLSVQYLIYAYLKLKPKQVSDPNIGVKTKAEG